MAQEVQTAQTKNFFEAYGDSVAGPNIIGSLLRFTKFGEWKAGQDETEVPMGTRLVVDVGGFKLGWLKWVDNRIVDNRLVAAADIIAGRAHPPVTRDQLGDTDQELWESFEDGRPKDPWVLTNVLTMIDPDTGELYTYSTQSKGGISAVGELAKAYGMHIRAHPNHVPTVELSMRTYEHREYGEIRNPKFILVRDGWMDIPPELRDAVPESYSDQDELPPPVDAPKLAPPQRASTRTVSKPAPRPIATKGRQQIKAPPPKAQRKNGPAAGRRF